MKRLLFFLIIMLLCIGDTSGIIMQVDLAKVTSAPLETGTITGGGSVSQNTTPGPSVTFCGANGTTPYTFTYTINGGNTQTISTTGANTCVSLNAPTNIAGTFIYTLTSPGSGSVTVTILPLPTGTISGGGTVCKDGTPIPIITFAGANGTPPYTFYYTINGGSTLSISTTSNNSEISFNVPTNTAGIFNYCLMSVWSVCGPNQWICGQPASGCVTAVVSSPTATITGSGGACNNTPPGPTITFCGTKGIAPYTFTYKINGGANQVISTSGSNTCVSINAPTGTAGQYTYCLVNVSDGISCNNTANGCVTVAIAP
jgi:hypothetical protein